LDDFIACRFAFLFVAFARDRRAMAHQSRLLRHQQSAILVA
jgi:hypothetical protein